MPGSLGGVTERKNYVNKRNNLGKLSDCYNWVSAEEHSLLTLSTLHRVWCRAVYL